MASDVPSHLTARKKPRQARAAVTVDAIFDATIQVLVAEGPDSLTTTRVAERAGVSVGTLYQYFPHKQALFYAVNERYLAQLALRIEAVCEARKGAPMAEMVESLIATYWAAKMERPEVTRALYRSVVELDNEALIRTFAERVDAATQAMLTSAQDATFADLATVNLTLITTVFGAVRSVFERNLLSRDARAVKDQLVLMCVTYLSVVNCAGQAPGAGEGSLRCGGPNHDLRPYDDSRCGIV